MKKTRKLQDTWSIFLLSIVSFLGVYLALGVTDISLPTVSLVSLAVTFVSTSLTILLFLALNFTGQDVRYRIKYLASGFIAIGGVRGFLFFSFLSELGLPNPQSLTIRVLTSAGFYLVWGLAFTQIEERLQSFRQLYKQRFSERATLLGPKANDSIQLAQSLDSIEAIQDLQKNLRSIADSARVNVHSESSLIEAADQIKNEIELSLRPLSHRIWFETNKSYPKFGWLEIIAESLRQVRISPSTATLFTSTAFFVGSLSLFEFSEVLVRTAAFLLTVWLTFTVFKAVLQFQGRSVPIGAAILFAASLLANYSGEILVGLVMGRTPFSQDLLLALGGPLATFGILWSLAIFGQLNSDISRIETALLETKAGDVDAVIAARFAGFLHNSIQSQLRGIALALEKSDPGDRSHIEEVLRRLDQLAEQSMGKEFINSSLLPKDRITQVIDSWSQIIAVEIDIDESIFESPKIDLVVEFIEEAIGNAVRHARVQKIAIALERRLEQVRIKVTHPLSEPSREKRKMGSEWVERFTLDHHVDVSSSGERRLEALI